MKKRKKIFITGVNGFVSSCFIRAYGEAFEIFGVSGSSLSENSTSKNFVKIHSYESNEFDKFFLTVRPDIVIHAGWAGVESSSRDQINQIENIRFASRLSALCLDSGVSYFIGLGSQAEYGPKLTEISILDKCEPTTLYGIAKQATFHLFKSQFQNQDISFCWVRLFSTYGPGEKLDWLLPSVIRALLRSQSIELTAGEQVWDFLHIEDAVSALRILIDREYVGLVNLGSGKAVVLRDIFDLLEKKLDRKGLLKVGKLAYRTNQIMHLQADINELKSIGWIPKIELNDGLDQLIAFYKDKHLIEMSDNSN